MSTPHPPGPKPEFPPAGVTMQPPSSRWRHRSLARRVTLLTTIAVGVSVTFVALGAYVTARQQLQEQLDDSLRERAEKVTAAISEFGYTRVDLPSYLFGASDVRLYFLTKSGGVRLLDNSSEPLPVGTPELRVARGESASSLRTIRAEGQEFRVVTVPTKVDDLSLMVAQSLDQQEALLSRIGWVCLLFGMVGVLGAGIAGWGVARNSLRPVRRLTTEVERIARTEDLAPLAVEGDDELARLATAFNQMLTVIDASREHQRRLVADAGHELRTPLTSLRTNVDLLIQSDQVRAGETAQATLAPESRAELLDDIRAQTDELTTLIGDLTELARTEPITPVVGEVDLSEIVDVAVARVRRRALDATFEVDVEHWQVLGEATALERAVTNLLDNAVKWSPHDGTVTVRLRAGELTVDDQGPGIAEADRARVFDRFWRAEESRSMPGSGLGLSIVRQVAERHAGTVAASAAPGGGARLTMRLPGRPGA